MAPELRALFFVVALCVLGAPAPVRAASDDEIVFAPLGDPLGTGVVRFRGLRRSDSDRGRPVIRILVVYVSGAGHAPPGVSYFRVDQSMDCPTRAVSTSNYVAWDAAGRELPSSNEIPPAASDQAPANLLGAYWDIACPLQQPPPLMIGPQSRGGLAPAPGVENAVARARELQALFVRASHLSVHGHFYEVGGVARSSGVTIFTDRDNVSREGDLVRLSEIWINGSGSPKPQSYSRIEVLIDCAAQTHRQEFRAWFDPEGSLVNVAGELRPTRIDPKAGDDQRLATACLTNPPTPAGAVYPTIAAAQAAVRAELSKDR